MEKQVGFQGRVDVMSMTPGWPMAILPDNIFIEDGDISSSGELGWSQTPVPKTSSNRYAKLQSQRSIHRGTSKYNYGYSTAERSNKPGLLLFSNDGYDSGEAAGCGGYYCAWVHDKRRRWCVACWTCIGLLSVLLLAVFAMILTWCIIIPRRPFLNLQGTASFPANFTLQVLVDNPNRVAVEYSSCTFYVSYNDTLAGEGTLTAFSQKAHKSKQLPLVFDVPKSITVKLLDDIKVRGNISLDVSGRMHSRIHVLGLPTPPVLMKLWCTVSITGSDIEVVQPCRLANHKFVW